MSKEQPVSLENVEEKKKSSTSNNNVENKLTKMPVKSRYGRSIKHVNLDNGSFNTSTKSSSSKILKDCVDDNGYNKVNDDVVEEEKECTKENGGGGGNDGVAIENEKINSLVDDDDEKEEIIVNVKMEELDETEAINNNEDDEIKKEIQAESIDDKKWFVGQIAWAHISHYPYWPCIITLEPGTDVYSKEKPLGRQKIAKFIHVQYFGDKGRHGWVTENSMMEYHGIDYFHKLAAESLQSKKKIDKRHNGFILKKSIKSKWQIAVDEAEQMVIMKVEDRIDIAEQTCATKIKKKPIKIENNNMLINNVVSNRKRGRPPRTSIEPHVKKAKVDTTIINDDNELNENDDDNKNIMNLTTDIPPTPPSSIKDSSDESSIVRKLNGKRRKTIKAGDFEIYFLAKKNYMINLPENTTDTDIRTFLQESWDKMLPWQRSQFSSESTPNLTPTKRRRKKSLNQENNLSSNCGDIPRRRRRRRRSSSNSSSSKSKSTIENDKIMEKYESSASTTSSSIDSTKKIKPFNLFKGARPERVCQICEKTGKLIRCRGPCYSYFHLDCVKPGDSESECDMDQDTASESQIKIETATESSSSSLSPSPVPVEETAATAEAEVNPLPLLKNEDSSSLLAIEEEDSSSSSSSSSTTTTTTTTTTIKEELTLKKDDPLPIMKKEDSAEEDNYFKCIDCLSGVAPACFICNEREEERTRCSIAACGKHYHSACLKLWPQSHWQGGRMTCPYHMCHTCISDNPQSYHHSRAPHDKLSRCVRCPSAYHASSACLPAGSKILTGSQVICPKHYVSPHPPLNAAWCFLCTRGGSLICCDTCPTSFHAECLGIKPPEGAFICEDCETGRLPLYGEVVWVKLGNWRWWPSRICFPHEIPTNLKSLSHSSGEFCVMFFGTHNYYWAHRGRCFLYQDGDLNAKVTAIGKKNLDESYKQAVDEANDLYQSLRNEKLNAKDSECTTKILKPPPYVKLKINKPVGNVKPVVEVESIVACECKPTWDCPCSSDTDCLNRILSIECNPSICPAGTKCNNQSFVSRNYPNMEPFHTAGRGWGLKTLEDIKNGQFVIEYVGEIIDENEYKKRLSRKKELRNENYYFLTIDNYRLIDAEPKGNLSRFMNHSCQPNCETQKWTVNGDTRIGIFALRDIQINEELTFNYNLTCDGEKKKPCLCGAPNCSGYIGLKAQKLQSNVVVAQQQAKTIIDTPDKIKRRRKLSRKIYKCWSCGIDVENQTSGIQCELKSCRKRYHRECVVNMLKDNTKFSCPWHHCLDCSRRTSAHCSFCSTAYCYSHLQDRLTEQKDRGGYLCKAHEDLLFEDDQDVETGENGDDKRPLSPEYPEPEESDEDFDAASLLADSDSPIAEEDDNALVNTDDNNTSVSTPISIIEVQLNNEEIEDLQNLDTSSDVDLDNNSDSDNSKEKNKINSMGYTTHQLHDIIGIGGGGGDDDYDL